MQIRELPIISKSKEEIQNKNLIAQFEFNEDDSPFLEYVCVLANKLQPVNEHNFNGSYTSGAVRNFLHRYYDNDIDKRGLKKYTNNDSTDVLHPVIESLGYDIEKFWYLSLFIMDYSIGQSLEGLKLKENPKTEIEKLLSGIEENTLSYDDDNKLAEFKKPMKLSLNIKGKKNIEIESSTAMVFLYAALKEVMNNENAFINSYNYRTISSEIISTSNSILIAYSAKLFQIFFELKPPKIKRKPKDSDLNYSKLLLISRMVYILRITNNETYWSTQEILKSILNQYKNLDFSDSVNGYYLF